MKTKGRVGQVAVMVAILLVGGGIAASKLFDEQPVSVGVISASTSPSAQTSVSPTPMLNPLTLSSMKAGSYRGSGITSERSLGDEGGYSARVVSFVSDGLTEYAYWAQPDGSMPAGGWPVIVLVHGYTIPSDYNTVTNAYVSWMAAWAKAGFVVVQPDLRGNGASGGTAVSGHWSPDYTYDVMNLIASLTADSVINAGHIGLVGHSMGGHVALNVADISSDVKATVLVNRVVGSMYNLFYNWPNSPAPNDQPAQVVKAELSGLEAAYGTPKSDPGFWNQASAINYVSGIKGPVQIDADIGDTTVPIAFSDELDAALGAAHKRVTFDAYPGDDHQLSSPSNLALFLAMTTAFWKQAL